MKYYSFIAVMLLLFSGLTQAEVVSKEITYDVDGQPYSGYFAYDNSLSGDRPGVLVVHEWWGHNAYARQRADQLAGLGYAAFALDMYGSGKLADHPDTAQKFMQAALSDPDQAARRFDAATSVLKQQGVVNQQKIAAIGYCFGGGVVLNMARAGMDLKGVVSFHGSLAAVNPAQPGEVKAQVLVYNGADDPMISDEQIEAFKQEMKAAGVDYKLVNLAGAKHSFTNPGADAVGQQFGMPLAYNKAADQQSWAGMKAFLESVFQ